MTSAIILQARMTSTRLPGKVLRTAGGRTILEWVVRGARMVPGDHVVCVAIPEGEIHDPVAAEAHRLRTVVVRGAEHDVLDRFKVAAEAVGADEVMRVTTDCPMMDPSLCGEVLALRRAEGTDYACNNEPFGYPHGLDCESFTAAVLERAALEANTSYDREHVTPWIKRDPSVRRSYLLGPGDERIHWRWTIDHPEDLEFFAKVVEALGDEISDWHRVSAFLAADPDLHEINRARRER